MTISPPALPVSAYRVNQLKTHPGRLKLFLVGVRISSCVPLIAQVKALTVHQLRREIITAKSVNCETTDLVGKHIHNICDEEPLLLVKFLHFKYFNHSFEHFIHRLGNHVTSHAKAAAQVPEILWLLDIDEVGGETVPGFEDGGPDIDHVGSLEDLSNYFVDIIDHVCPQRGE